MEFVSLNFKALFLCYGSKANTGISLSKTIILTELHFCVHKKNLANKLGWFFFIDNLRLGEAASVGLSLRLCSLLTAFSKNFRQLFLKYVLCSFFSVLI